MTDANTREEAARWFAALRRGPMSLTERAQFDVWRADPANQRALDAMHQLWGEVSAIKTVGAYSTRRRPLRPAFVAAAAAVVLCAAGLGVLLATAPEAQAHIQTRIGEQQTRTLPDGSVVAVNVVTSLDYRMSSRLRAVELKDGEATFFVKKSPERPFVVKVGDYRISAVGTAFDVRFRDGVVEVSVAEGMVDISGGQGAPVIHLTAGKRVQLAADGRSTSAGQAGAAADVAAAVIRPADTQGFAEWRLRNVTYEDIPVSTVVEDLNRFYDRPVEVLDPALARRRVTIHLQVHERDETLRTLAALLAAEVRPGQQADVLAAQTPAAGAG